MEGVAPESGTGTAAMPQVSYTDLEEKLARAQRERDEALEQQNASAEVLRVISSSVADTEPVFEIILRSCERLFAGLNVGINVVGADGAVHLAAYHGRRREQLESHFPVPLSEESGSGAAIVRGVVVHYPDIEGGIDVPDYARRGSMIVGNKSVIFAPMLWEGRAIGAIFVGRKYIGPFSDKEIALLKTFADQAVIAIQNARLFREIEERGRQLAEASQHKSQFLANMSHELRTPLNAILGYTELILDSVYGEMPEKARIVLDRVQRNGRHLLGLINDVLDLSKIEAGQLTLSLSDYSLKNVIQTVFSAVEPLAAQKQLALKIDVAPELPQGRGDEQRLTQVLLNLVGNAIKFTDRGEVSINGSSANGSFTVAVRDTGPGISAVDQAKLFQEFQQADNSITRKKGGTGLGLAISKRIIEMHGGRIWVESSPGNGSTFAFTLPVTVEGQARPA
jgi:signal transduction histidine kinase